MTDLEKKVLEVVRIYSEPLESRRNKVIAIHFIVDKENHKEDFEILKSWLEK